MSDLNLKGIFPPIPTPFDAAGEFDPRALAGNMAIWNEWPLAGIVAGGSNGEFVHLSNDEKRAVIREVRAHLPADRLLIAGAGEPSARMTIILANQMADAGADALLVVSPHYYKSQMTAEALVSYYREVADNSPRPILLYNVPANTGLDIPIEAVRELADHENIIGMKDSGGDVARLAQIAAGVSEGFQLLAGSASFLLPALTVGAVGAVSALANLFAANLDDLVSLYESGGLTAARALQQRLVEPNRMVTSRYGVAGLKAALEMAGMAGGPVRLPLLRISQEDRDEIRAVFQQAGLWPAV